MAKILGTAIASIDDLNYFKGNAKKHDIGKIIESIKEIDTDGFEFDCECPKCGFQFTKITK